MISQIAHHRSKGKAKGLRQVRQQVAVAHASGVGRPDALCLRWLPILSVAILPTLSPGGYGDVDVASSSSSDETGDDAATREAQEAVLNLLQHPHQVPAARV